MGVRFLEGVKVMSSSPLIRDISEDSARGGTNTQRSRKVTPIFQVGAGEITINESLDWPAELENRLIGKFDIFCPLIEKPDLFNEALIKAALFESSPPTWSVLQRECGLVDVFLEPRSIYHYRLHVSESHPLFLVWCCSRFAGLQISTQAHAVAERMTKSDQRPWRVFSTREAVALAKLVFGLPNNGAVLEAIKSCGYQTLATQLLAGQVSGTST
jgi:hypothetical protein